MNQNNFEFDSCSENSIKVCIGTINCDIKVNTNENSVEKNGEKKVYFEGDALMYAAIFSDRATYECEVKRLMKRSSELSDIYKEKSLNLLNLGCSPFNGLRNSFSSVESSSDLAFTAQDIKQVENTLGCDLWWIRG